MPKVTLPWGTQLVSQADLLARVSSTFPFLPQDSLSNSILIILKASLKHKTSAPDHSTHGFVDNLHC